MQELRLIDPDGYTVCLDTPTTIVVPDDQAAAVKAQLLGAPAAEDAETKRALQADHARYLGAAASASLMAQSIYRASNYTVQQTPITPAELDEDITYYASRFLQHRAQAAAQSLGYSNAYAYAAWGRELAGRLGRPDLRGAALTQAAESALSHTGAQAA
ncbi:hypothetical protein OH809_45380 (plasmid) [Streptomyces sp. NBC_00873]|uniref:hypothetical protein n=1 Tax=Streptomyces sp. NBC_00873 TaxID=2975852 RepID=UPI0037DD1A76|nr:hypothetical protein OH809_45380 [Streptomyces sp. NBC_00873]